MESPTLRIRLFGALDLRLGEVALPPLDSARAESLLAYLLLHRDAPQSRQRLAFLLWPDSTEAQARTNLRHVLHTLRRALPDLDRFLDVTPRTLQWRANAAVLARRRRLRGGGRAGGAGRTTAARRLAGSGRAVRRATCSPGATTSGSSASASGSSSATSPPWRGSPTLLEARGDHARAIVYAERLPAASTRCARRPIGS